MLFTQKIEVLDEASSKKSKYHADEVPEHSILKESHDLGHLVKMIEKPMKKSTGAEDSTTASEDAPKKQRGSVLFTKAIEVLDEAHVKKSKYHADEVPGPSILKDSHDLGHLVKKIDPSLIKHSAAESGDDSEDSDEEEAPTPKVSSSRDEGLVKVQM